LYNGSPNFWAKELYNYLPTIRELMKLGSHASLSLLFLMEVMV
jgi:hypothetical protein